MNHKFAKKSVRLRVPLFVFKNNFAPTLEIYFMFIKHSYLVKKIYSRTNHKKVILELFITYFAFVAFEQF